MVVVGLGASVVEITSSSLGGWAASAVECTTVSDVANSSASVALVDVVEVATAAAAFGVELALSLFKSSSIEIVGAAAAGASGWPTAPLPEPEVDDALLGGGGVVTLVAVESSGGMWIGALTWAASLGVGADASAQQAPTKANHQRSPRVVVIVCVSVVTGVDMI